jgi:hypothetical protein
VSEPPAVAGALPEEEDEGGSPTVRGYSTAPRRKPDRQGGCRQKPKVDRERQNELRLERKRPACMVTTQTFSPMRQILHLDWQHKQPRRQKAKGKNGVPTAQGHNLIPSPLHPFGAPVLCPLHLALPGSTEGYCPFKPFQTAFEVQQVSLSLPLSRAN